MVLAQLSRSATPQVATPVTPARGYDTPDEGPPPTQARTPEPVSPKVKKVEEPKIEVRTTEVRGLGGSVGESLSCSKVSSKTTRIGGENER